METTISKRFAVGAAVEALVAFMNEAEKAHKEAHFPMLKPDFYWVDGGRKYLRIAQGPAIGTGASVHCFVDAETGGVYKAAGWKKPALNGERFNLLDPVSFDELKRNWDPYTSYLYK